jgi:hypothetical protein
MNRRNLLIVLLSLCLLSFNGWCGDFSDALTGKGGGNKGNKNNDKNDKDDPKGPHTAEDEAAKTPTKAVVLLCKKDSTGKAKKDALLKDLTEVLKDSGVKDEMKNCSFIEISTADTYKWGDVLGAALSKNHSSLLVLAWSGGQNNVPVLVQAFNDSNSAKADALITAMKAAEKRCEQNKADKK